MLIYYNIVYLFVLGSLLSVTGLLKLTPNNREIVSFINKSYMSTCSDTTGDATNWLNPQGRLIPYNHGQPHLENTVNGTAIVFEAISTNHKGLYTCINIKTNERIVFELQVFTPISFYNTRSIQTVNEGENALITCFAHADPKPEISWQAVDKELTPPKYWTSSRGLTINNVNHHDSGIYTCKATQISAKLSDFQIKTIHVKVLHGPKKPLNKSMYMKFEPVFGLLGSSTNLTCTAIAEPNAKFSWFRDGQEQVNTNYIFPGEHSSTLQIDIRNPSRFGEYICKAENTHGTLEQVFSLQEGLALPPPKEIQLNEVTNDSAILRISEPEIRNRQIPITMRLNGFRFEIHSNHSADVQIVDFFSTKNSLYKLINLEKNSIYEIRVASLNAAGVGNFSSVFHFETSHAAAFSNCVSLLLCFCVFIISMCC